jgi:hypothetical protein
MFAVLFVEMVGTKRRVTWRDDTGHVSDCWLHQDGRIEFWDGFQPFWMDKTTAARIRRAIPDSVLRQMTNVV